jgi:hypothetical protein
MIDGSNLGAFVNQTQVWDSKDPAELLVRLYQQLNTIALVLNIKDSGYYALGEFVNGQLYFPNPAYNSQTVAQAEYRQVFRLVVNFGALPNTGAKSVAHGLSPNSGWMFTRIYACASDTTGLNYLPIPSTQANLTVNSTNVTITTTANLSNYNLCVVVLEYIKF